MGVVDSATRSEIPRADHGHVRHPANILQCAELRARIYAAHYCDGLRAVTAHLMAIVPFRSRARLGFRFRHVPLCSFRYRSRWFMSRSLLLLTVRSLFLSDSHVYYSTLVAEDTRRINLYSLASVLRSRAIPTPDLRPVARSRAFRPADPNSFAELGGRKSVLVPFEGPIKHASASLLNAIYYHKYMAGLTVPMDLHGKLTSRCHDDCDRFL